MTDVFFYHLEHSPLEAALPKLLAMCLQRCWRVAVQAGSIERVDALDAQLWAYADDSFLPHGTARDGFADQQPVFLTADDSCPNGARVRFFVDRAQPGDDLAGLDRAVLMFDGRDPDALGQARQDWKRLKDSGHALKYYQQGESGGWELKAQAAAKE